MPCVIQTENPIMDICPTYRCIYMLDNVGNIYYWGQCDSGKIPDGYIDVFNKSISLFDKEQKIVVQEPMKIFENMKKVFSDPYKKTICYVVTEKDELFMYSNIESNNKLGEYSRLYKICDNVKNAFALGSAVVVQDYNGKYYRYNIDKNFS